MGYSGTIRERDPISDLQELVDSAMAGHGALQGPYGEGKYEEEKYAGGMRKPLRWS